MFKKSTWAVYSGYKMCIVDQMLGQLEDGKESFESNLEHVQVWIYIMNEWLYISIALAFLSFIVWLCLPDILQIVDQQVKPKYLKNYMKNLKSLYIDWQEEIASG